MATQTGSFDLKALREAAKKAINYVTDMANGIFVHPEGDTANGVRITDKVDVVRDSTNVASFGDEAVIGTDDTGKLIIDRSGIGGYGPDSTVFFDVKGSGTSMTVLKKTESETLSLTPSSTCTYTAEELDGLSSGSAVYFCISRTGLSGSMGFTKGTAETRTNLHYSVHYDGAHTFSAIRTVSGSYDCIVYAQYYSSAPAPYYLFGQMYADPGAAPGPYSMQEGVSIADGSYAHAEGYQSQASGDYSHAQNVGTIAADYAQTAIGMWNVADNTGTYYALIIGNGTEDTDRSNAFSMTWEGDPRLALDTAGSGSTEFDDGLYNEIRGLGWQSEVII